MFSLRSLLLSLGAALLLTLPAQAGGHLSLGAYLPGTTIAAQPQPGPVRSAATAEAEFAFVFPAYGYLHGMVGARTLFGIQPGAPGARYSPQSILYTAGLGFPLRPGLVVTLDHASWHNIDLAGRTLAWNRLTLSWVF